jgi:hypothetical protein
VYSQDTLILENKKVQRLIFSTDLETIFSWNESLSKSLYANNHFFNFLYENEIGNRTTILYGVEYQNLYSEVVISGRLVGIYFDKNYYLKCKYNYYILPFNKNDSPSQSGLYLGAALKIGGSKSDKYNSVKVSPGALLGYCFQVSKKISLHIEFDLDGYWEWRNEIDKNEGYAYKGLTNMWRNLWFSLGYRL